MPKKDDIPVLIKPNAYYKMLVHVLRFGSKVKDPNQCKEVMGGLIGHIETKEEKPILIIEDAIPVSHGGAIEVRYSPDQLGSFAEIDNRVFEEHGEEGWFSCGWYHSHPGLSAFFSGTDVMNQLFWQAKNPAGVGLVFDHTYLENPDDLGFKAFRLDDPSKSRNTGYHEVQAKVEPPDDISYYFKIIDLIDGIYTKKLPIMELNETTNFFEDVLIPEKEKLMIKKPEINFNRFINSFQAGITKFMELSLRPLVELLNSWSQDMLKKTFFNNTQMRQDLEEMKNKLSEGMMNIQQTFNYSLHDELGKLDIFIDDRLDVLRESQSNLQKSEENFGTEFSSFVEPIFADCLKEYFENNLELFENSVSEINEINEKQVELINSLEQGNISLQEVLKMLEPSIIRIMGGLEKQYDVITEKFKKKLRTITGNVENLEKESKRLLSDLKAAILVLEGSKEPILNKIERLEDDKKNLLDKIKQLKIENKELLDKNKKIGKEGQ